MLTQVIKIIFYFCLFNLRLPEGANLEGQFEFSPKLKITSKDRQTHTHNAPTPTTAGKFVSAE